VVVSASAAQGLNGGHQLDDGIRVTVPEFARQARLLAAGRALDLIRDLGGSGAVRATRAAVPAGLRERGATFWVAAEALLAASLAGLPADFRGALLLHPYVVDLALALDRPDRVARLLAACRAHAPHARVGVHSNLAADVARLDVVGATPDVVHVLSSPSARAVPQAFALLRSLWPRAELVA